MIPAWLLVLGGCVSPLDLLGQEEIVIDSSHGVMIEYSRWQPAQDDPGDFYAFVPTDIVALGFHFGHNEVVPPSHPRFRP